ncbi:MAG: type II toxin-antitoxin system RelE/ParE family toxin [Anaerolineae bacterium]|nr:type II toxin-antitoxin system RelE/ParE family toxin [Phycisphaerae bacterium]
MKQIGKLDGQVRRRIDTAILALGDNPRPPGSKKLVNVEAWRIRVGDWRVIYQINDKQLLVLVVRIGHRRDVYE